MISLNNERCFWAAYRSGSCSRDPALSCRPSLSLSIVTRHLPQAPSLPHSLTPFFCSWPGSPATIQKLPRTPGQIGWSDCERCHSYHQPTVWESEAQRPYLTLPSLSLLFLSYSHSAAFPFFLCKFQVSLLAWLYYIWYCHSIRVKTTAKQVTESKVPV